MQQINFDHNGDKLWAQISMKGAYLIFYSYSLLAADNQPGEAVLTNPQIAGNNRDNNGAGTYCFQVINNFVPGEPLSAYSGRYIDVTFFVKMLQDDAGFNLSVSLLQGADCGSAKLLGTANNDPAKNTLATNGDPNLEIKFQII